MPIYCFSELGVLMDFIYVFFVHLVLVPFFAPHELALFAKQSPYLRLLKDGLPSELFLSYGILVFVGIFENQVKHL